MGKDDVGGESESSVHSLLKSKVALKGTYHYVEIYASECNGCNSRQSGPSWKVASVMRVMRG